MCKLESTLCGIDEAGRGPLAGPLVMAGVMLNVPIDELDDSKKLSAKKRDKLFDIIIANSRYHIVIIEPQTIDEKGLSWSLQSGLKEIMQTLHARKYLFDGNTTFGIPNLSSQIKADSDVVEVSAASILAKVTRDRIMLNLDRDYPDYGFKKHKGYGTKEHIQAIARYGYSAIHRKSFQIKTLLQPSLFEGIV